MFNRQKTILCLLAGANREVSRIELMKWAFILSREYCSRKDGPFYDFVPYQYGPFSFALYRDMEPLVERGLVMEVSEKTWQITLDCEDFLDDLSSEVRDGIAETIKRFADESQKSLMDYVYEKYPWFTVNSNKKKLGTRPQSEPATYTLGYEGASIDAFLNTLVRKGVRHVLDVRKNPISRRYGFHKSSLQRLCGNLDIDYSHFPQVGIPSEFRKNLKTSSDYKKLFKMYERDILSSNSETIQQISDIMASEPAVLVCSEASPQSCHRSVLARAVSESTKLTIRHLGILV
ncbi:DUF488 family protein [Candidatus Hydrogenedentota bacterium]